MPMPGAAAFGCSTRRVPGLTGTSTTSGSGVAGPLKPAAARCTRARWPSGPRNPSSTQAWDQGGR